LGPGQEEGERRTKMVKENILVSCDFNTKVLTNPLLSYTAYI